MKLKAEDPKGLLHRAQSRSRFQLERWDPTDAEVASFVSHYWFVSWDLTGQEPYDSENLPYPSVHLVVQRGQSGIFGIPRGKFVRRLDGKDRVFGMSFRPGGFYPLVQVPIYRFSGRRTLLSDVFGAAGAALEDAILDVEGRTEQIALAEAFVRARHVEPHPMVDFVSGVVDRIAGDRALVRVEEVAHEAGLSRRHLERLFRQYVGVSPKWVIQRYRLFEAADRLASEPDSSTAYLAQLLGYCDQAHFAREFKAMVGSSPAEYARANFRCKIPSPFGRGSG
jgi:AraC-like DNA-binding protein